MIHRELAFFESLLCGKDGCRWTTTAITNLLRTEISGRISSATATFYSFASTVMRTSSRLAAWFATSMAIASIQTSSFACGSTNQCVAMPEYVEMAAGSRVAREQLASHIKTAAGQHGISGSDLKTLRLPMPDTARQESIAAEVRSKGERRLVTEHEAARALTLLDRLEQSILARAFRGELVPQDLAEAAAPVKAVDPPKPARARRSRAA